MNLQEAMQHFQAGVDAMLSEGAGAPEVAGTLLGLAHRVMSRHLGPAEATEWLAHMAAAIAAGRVDPDAGGGAE